MKATLDAEDGAEKMAEPTDRIEPSRRLRAEGVVHADAVEEGDVVFASYMRDGTLMCAWLKVREIKHHTESTVTFIATLLDDAATHRWAEYPREAPLVLGLEG